ncbi:Transcriptional regulator (TetR/AcrR family) [Mycobacteroides abscessus subsp. massiliense]|nr:Transcriptional regulator (TetR/AcrR family) [Mycobacteroides abscessus subsp. massiliense]
MIDSYFQRTLAAVNDTSDLSGNAGDFEQHLRTVFTRLFDMLDNSPEILQVILREGLLDSAMTKRMFGILDLIESVNITIIEQARADGTRRSEASSREMRARHTSTRLSSWCGRSPPFPPALANS